MDCSRGALIIYHAIAVKEICYGTFHSQKAIHFNKYTTASDVWSFGAVMYEIWSLGHKPFEGYTNHQVMLQLIDWITKLSGLIYVTVVQLTGGRGGRQWLPPTSTPWLSQGTLQFDDPVLVRERLRIKYPCTRGSCMQTVYFAACID